MKLGKIGVINAPQPEPISIRCYTGNYRVGGYSPHNQNANNGMVLILTSETTLDQQQSLTFSSCAVWINGSLYKICLFHNELDEKKVDMIRQVAETLQKEKNCIVTVSSKDEFVTSVFYPYVYEARAKCVSFDLPYELSRLAASWGTARKIQDAFSIKLVDDNPRLPAIKIKSINSDAAFIQFATPLRTKSEKKQIPTHKVYRGYFVDLKTLGYAMSNKSFDGMDEVAKTFGVNTNLQNRKGITKDAIRNNVEKTLTVYNLYCKIISVLENTFLVKPNDSNKLYSPASIGKLYLEKLNIKPLLEKNQDFSKNIVGNLMTAFYAGRVETRIRKTPVPVTYLDCTSTYPTLFSLMDMYSFLSAEKIEHSVTTEKTQKFLAGITLQDISQKDTWRNLTTICKVVPDGSMIVPVRCSYGSKKTQNIGVNYLKSTDGTSPWYTVSDLIASKLLTGHTPTIEKVITFSPLGIQQNIPDEKIEIFKGVTVNPRKENFIEQLIEKKLEMKQCTVDSEIEKTIQNTIKIIANTASYGIHIQVNTESEKQNEPVTVYGIDESFSVDPNTTSRKEIPAKHFNPILGVFLPAAARLVLAAAESIVTSHRDGYVAYMDTDSIMVSPKHASEIQGFFQKLNPYENDDVQVFKIEKSDDGKLLDNVLFFGVSSKRYVLFEYDDAKDKFNIHKFTSHGLAHLLDVDAEKWWQDILAMHYSPENKQEILDNYDSKYAVSKMSITTPNVLKRFSNLRPFNKILVGAGCKTDENGNVVIPTLPYLDAKNRECIQYMPFTNYTTGEKFPDSADTIPYWKPLSETLDDYADHREAKSGGDVGLLPRLRMKIDKNQIKYVGKEVANLDVSNVLGVTQNESCTVYDNLEEKILDIRPRDSHKFGISRSNLISLQKKIRENGVLKLHKKTIEKIIAGSIMARGGDAI
ncbi:MAG: hypothetical protein OEL81_00450 [Nitrosopumilus sp.]|nr:hypothetical protein [Nitrosopumilus sp.]